MTDLFLMLVMGLIQGFGLAQITGVLDLSFQKGHIWEFVRLRRARKVLQSLDHPEKERLQKRYNLLHRINYIDTENMRSYENISFVERANDFQNLYWQIAVVSKDMQKIVCKFCMGLRYIMPIAILFNAYFYLYVAFLPEYFLVSYIMCLAGFFYFINK